MTAHVLGFPRIGRQRELKRAVEGFWQGKIEAAELQQVGARLRVEAWQAQRAAGLDLVAVGDFSFYDLMLDWIFHLGVVPSRFAEVSGPAAIDEFTGPFALARGTLGQAPLEMTKWFDTNYHYLVPELSRESAWTGWGQGLLDQVTAALASGLAAATIKPVLIGPVTFLYLSKWQGPGQKLEALPAALHVYRRLLTALKNLGVEWVQADEPILALDLTPQWQAALQTAWTDLAGVGPSVLLTTYFGGVEHQRSLIDSLPVAGVHLDLVRGGLPVEWLDEWPTGRILSAGLINGRNVWRADSAITAASARRFRQRLGDRLWLASSCSLLHSPVDLASENHLPEGLRDRLAFAVQKLTEVAQLKSALDQPEGAGGTVDPISSDRTSVSPTVPPPSRTTRALPIADRLAQQAQRLQLPAWPTTTIGSFPQTAELRQLRQDWKAGRLTDQAYETGLQAEIRQIVEIQEAIGLDVLVHGEPERNDMAEHFGELLDGYAFTQFGWVQSYGTRCVKPPIIFDTVRRRAPMTVAWSRFAQSLTTKPMKAMLTGPVTLLQWAFCREDRPRAAVAFEIAEALRAEVADLEAAGLTVIQVDEPAFREGLPLRRADQPTYWTWATQAFRLATAGAAPTTQIHTHMCYSDFKDCLDRIAELDADVITIETTRSDMALLEAFRACPYPGQVGPGVWDIHSPRIAQTADMVRLLKKAATDIPAAQLWVNPDCGLKTRQWAEVKASLINLVAAARQLRAGPT